MGRIINYPIAYAVLELKEKYKNMTNGSYITQGFIVSKCYVLESSIKYDSDSGYKLKHKVVFPYKDFTSFKTSFRDGKQKIGDPQIPVKNAYNDIYSYDIVDNLFNTYEEAKASANEKNEEYVNNVLMDIPAQVGSPLRGLNDEEQYRLVKQKFEDRLVFCYQFEELVLRATRDMQISEDMTNTKYIKVLTPVKKQV